MRHPDPTETCPERAATSAAFAAVDTWVFDLDNTLYPPDSDLWPKIDNRITTYLAELYGIDGQGARALQKHYYQRHGTTLKALIEEGVVDPEDFLSFVHDIDRSTLRADLRLERAIAALPGRKLILTNGSARHAEQTARAIGIDHLFEGIFDIAAAGYVPKPEAIAYQRFFDRYGVAPSQAAMFEDIVKNLKVPFEQGMRTVLVVGAPDRHDHREEWERRQAVPPFVQHVTSDLAGFLESLPAGGRPAQ